uniref:UDENN domain-containing protein n=1 Tax=Panagrellus redivivus TaxID=6233 RepID=A0A7E4W5N5_PANRE
MVLPDVEDSTTDESQTCRWRGGEGKMAVRDKHPVEVGASCVSPERSGPHELKPPQTISDQHANVIASCCDSSTDEPLGVVKLVASPLEGRRNLPSTAVVIVRGFANELTAGARRIPRKRRDLPERSLQLSIINQFSSLLAPLAMFFSLSQSAVGKGNRVRLSQLMSNSKDSPKCVVEPRLSLDLPPLERFNDWIRCICVVTFDLELGQVIETVYPGDVELTQQEKLNICYLSFPDSNSGVTQDTSYHFRIRQSNVQLTPVQQQFARDAPVFLHVDQTQLYGFVHFRQQRNPALPRALPRGYYQKILVIFTVFPLFGLFNHLVDTLANQFFECGEAAIESACHHIDHWPLPDPGDILNLHFLGSVIHCRIPLRSDIPQKQLFLDFTHYNDSPQPRVLLPTIHETNLFESLQSAVSHVQILWELILLNEPLVIMAPTPAVSSDLIQSLCSIIWPLGYAGDFRPFFTIHDSDFSEITTNPQRDGILLGVTNPFFSKALQDWPHILRVGDPNAGQMLNAEKHYKKPWDGRTLDSKPGFYSVYKPFITTDKSLLKKLVKVGSRPNNVQNAILRRHFLELTQCFMIPLERYLSTLMPLRKQISPFKALPQAKPFRFDEFWALMNKTGPPVLTGGVKGDLEGLYRRFIGTSNFNAWLTSRMEDVERQLKDTHLEVLCTTDLSRENISTRQQVEIVDLILKIQDKLKDLDIKKQHEKRQKLKSQLNAVMQSVDEELKAILLSNGALREEYEM